MQRSGASAQFLLPLGTFLVLAGALIGLVGVY